MQTLLSLHEFQISVCVRISRDAWLSNLLFQVAWYWNLPRNSRSITNTTGFSGMSRFEVWYLSACSAFFYRKTSSWLDFLALVICFSAYNRNRPIFRRNNEPIRNCWEEQSCTRCRSYQMKVVRLLWIVTKAEGILLRVLCFVKLSKSHAFFKKFTFIEDYAIIMKTQHLEFTLIFFYLVIRSSKTRRKTLLSAEHFSLQWITHVLSYFSFHSHT